MQTRLSLFCQGMIEAIILAVVVLVSLFFNVTHRNQASMHATCPWFRYGLRPTQPAGTRLFTALHAAIGIILQRDFDITRYRVASSPCLRWRSDTPDGARTPFSSSER
jgi:hypothetical protein